MSRAERRIRFFRASGLQRKLMLVFVILVGGMGGIGRYVPVEHELQMNAKMLESWAMHMEDMLRIALRPSRSNMDKFAVEFLLGALASNTEIGEFTATEAGTGIAASIGARVSAGPTDEVVQTRGMFDKAWGAAPTEKISDTQIVLLDPSVNDSSRHALVALLASMVFVSLGLCASVYLLLTCILHRPVREIKAVVDAISTSNVEARSSLVEGVLADISGRRRAHESLRRHHTTSKREITERKRAECDLVTSQEQLHRLSSHTEAIREDERKQIAMMIHDELGQILTALRIDLSLLKERMGPESAEISTIEQMRALVDKTLEIGRDIANHLRPAALNFGLVSALEWLAAEFSRHGSTRCRFFIDGVVPKLSEGDATAVFRIAQEALTNVTRHAVGATQVELRLTGSVGGLELAVVDDGPGFDPSVAARGGSYGLPGMMERARLLGADLNVESEEGRGTAIYLTLKTEFVSAMPAEVS
ncbi:sensor histidine kinase [Burkholderia sola]|uniref:sensor histidine kinase n=1 Tax=Burkholderia sola TaxID=2843302 RepID=UPI0023DD8E5A|nr:sensor histidine kinase [Burkholderia sola]MDF3084877.1 sensor histidine kinase [Burkholderia sola]